MEVGLYRVAVEALNNVISHASASRLSVIVVWQSSRIMLLMEDNGRGFDYPSVRSALNGCNGLIAMEERVNQLGGTLHIESRPDEGTTVRAEIEIEMKS